MRKMFCTAIVLLAPFSAFAQDVAVDANTKNGFIAVVIVIIAVAMIAHMLYENLFRKNLRTDYTATAFRNLRKEKNLGDMSAQEAVALESELDEMIAQWGKLPNEDGEMVPYPLKHSVVKKSLATLEKAVAAMPTNSRIVERINGANEILNHAQQRQFNGSKAMVVTSIIVGIVIGAIVGRVDVVVSICVGIILYLLGSRSTTFLIADKQLKGSSGSMLANIISSLFMGATQSKTTATYGSGSTKTNNAKGWISLILGLVVMVALSALIPVIAVVNYIRNYIIYW